ncbi:hypothetical protein L484_018291 [Morus notabilis]|uniref:Glabrous enhancer-binding protein-like DBD domain-containing protein n=1 Tax=Morus notabilis TaxID=981085 RepID=W9SAQ1_9ROSA|nr:STOREKEEPER protein [Morus notabilis]EXC23160.1 hypothetical protein L484_018291 [Morus notabilis]
MAPKRLLEKPPPADSSSEDKDESDSAENEEENGKGNENGAAGADDEEEKSGGDEEVEDESPVKKPTVSKPDDSGSGSDTESDDTPPSPSLSGFTIKPIVSKPMDDTADKPKKKSSARPNKRATESEDPERETSEKDSKSKKKRKVTSAAASASVTASNGGGDEEDSKKSSGFARVWSEDDEIAVLKGMTDYKAKKGADPYADMGAFHDFIKKSLNADVSKSQLVDKIRRLKKKYLNNAAKGENDEDPVFSKPHELLSFKLSKKIWGIGAKKSPNGNNVEDSDLKSRSSKKTPVPSTPVSKSTTTVLALPSKEMSVKKEKKKREQVEANGKVRVEKEGEDEDEDEEEEEEDEEGGEEEEFWDKYPHLNKSLESCFSSEFKICLPLVETSKLEKLDKKWRELQIEELGLFVRKAHLSQEQAELVLGVLKRSV